MGCVNDMRDYPNKSLQDYVAMIMALPRRAQRRQFLAEQVPDCWRDSVRAAVVKRFRAKQNKTN